MKAGWRGEEVGVVISIKAGVELWLKWVDPAGVDVPTTVVNPDAWRDRWIFKWVPNDEGVVVAFPNLDVVEYRWSPQGDRMDAESPLGAAAASEEAKAERTTAQARMATPPTAWKKPLTRLASDVENQS